MSLARTSGAYGRTTNCRRKVTAAHHVSGHAGKIGYALVLPGTRVDAFSKAVGEVLRDARRIELASLVLFVGGLPEPPGYTGRRSLAATSGIEGP